MNISNLLSTKDFMKNKYQRKMPKYIQKTKDNKYIIQKQIKKKTNYYGTFDTLVEALDMRDKFIENGWDNDLRCLKRKNFRRHNKATKYIHKTKGGKYFINKCLNGENVHFGVYSSLTEAQKMRDKLIENNWDKNLTNTRNYNKTTYETKHIQKYRRKCGEYSYTIYKYIGGVHKIFGTFHSLEDAIAQRDLLIKCNWDEDLACEYCGEI